ncbi:hypothetical protein FHX34_103932 [Actinoplanes teichomyceticus]|uniref:Uncharacterized protein n=1 Tax=Actinoplanes teichomyceticus TaxID=1867 RepID=A0A561WC05_ACTTI|nr:hypothetical protein FHX34_103932 [Actinoplanes teichomyceticus]GIF17196.1 hypothetical protein Ate01nite_72280 [Actinoplanes teichomyceticus]
MAAATAQAGGGRAATAAACGPARRRYVPDTDPARLAAARAELRHHACAAASAMPGPDGQACRGGLADPRRARFRPA